MLRFYNVMYGDALQLSVSQFTGSGRPTLRVADWGLEVRTWSPTKQHYWRRQAYLLAWQLAPLGSQV